MGERLAYIQKVIGSIPMSPTILFPRLFDNPQHIRDKINKRFQEAKLTEYLIMFDDENLYANLLKLLKKSRIPISYCDIEVASALGYKCTIATKYLSNKKAARVEKIITFFNLEYDIQRKPSSKAYFMFFSGILFWRYYICRTHSARDVVSYDRL